MENLARIDLRIYMNNIFYVIISVSLLPVFLLFFANPLLVENSFILLDATSSGGHASSTGVASSTGGGSSGGGGGGFSVAPKEIDIFVTIPSVDARFNRIGFIQLDWETRDTITLVDIKTVSRKDIVQFDNLPMVIKTDQKFFTENISSGEFSYMIKDNIPYGVHQIPLIITVNDGYRDYTTQSFLTMDNTGFFFLLEPFRGIFGTPSTIFETN
mgnify:CR=1 FL=1